MKEELMKRFTTYAKIDTQSNEDAEITPTTPGQLELANRLVLELKEIGMEDASMDENGYVMATLPANTDANIPTVGFAAHLDTATELTGKNVRPRIQENVDGTDIVLNEEKNVVLSSEDFPELANYIGHTLITTDGTTLLGADNKAGITEIMCAMNYFILHPEIEHGRIRIAFTPDEEIGRGPHKFDVNQFDATYGYTVDGGKLGELQYENFNAAAAKILFKGKNVHPGSAKGKMINAGKMAAEFIAKFPEEESPEHTEGYEGFYHLLSMNGDVESTKLSFIIRDHDKEQFAKRKTFMKNTVNEMREKYGQETIELEITDQYYNMREKVEPVIEIVDTAKMAMENLDIQPITDPIRGGTDGAQISYMGLPMPNLFTGGENFHSKYEYISVDNMEKAVRVIVEICRLFAAQNK